MPRQRPFISFLLSLVSFIHVATSAPTSRILINREDFENSTIFDASHYSSVSEWFSAQGHIIEMVNNATKECLSHFTVEEDSSVCYGADRWEWNAVAVICITAILAGVIVAIWLCCDWMQTSALWLLGDAKAEGESSSDMDNSPIEKKGEEDKSKPKEPGRRVDSVHSQDIDNGDEAEVEDAEKRVDSVHSHPADSDMLSMPALAGHGAMSSPPRFKESDSDLRNLGWLR
jgi:hypothetical protein